MMTQRKVKVPDGSIVTINAPKDATDTQLMEFAEKYYAKNNSPEKKQVEIVKLMSGAIVDANKRTNEITEEFKKAVQNINITVPDVVIPEIVIPKPEVQVIHHETNVDGLMKAITRAINESNKYSNELAKDLIRVVSNINFPEQKITIPKARVQVIHHETKTETVKEVENVKKWIFKVERDNRGLMTNITAVAG